MPNNIKIAITGGIGSGKSVASDILKKKGYVVFDLDKIYSDLLKDRNFVEKICRITGTLPKIVDGEITIDRIEISKKAYIDKTILSSLNNFTHPAIISEFLKRAEKIDGLVFCEVPLLFEGGYRDMFDFVFVIKRSVEERISSVVKRDGKTTEQIQEIMKNQFDYANLIPDEHTIIIENDSDIDVFSEKLNFALKQILQ